MLRYLVATQSQSLALPQCREPGFSQNPVVDRHVQFSPLPVDLIITSSSLFLWFHKSALFAVKAR